MTPGLGEHNGRRPEPADSPNFDTDNLNDGKRNGGQESFGVGTRGGTGDKNDESLNSTNAYLDGSETLDQVNAEYERWMSYSDSVDYYSLLGVSRNPPPTDAQLRSAYRSLSLSFYPDKQPGHLREITTKQYDRIREAYETLIDPKKRVVYDLLGEDGVRAEWGPGGVMGSGAAARGQQVGIRAMTAEEFHRWFLKTMKNRERKEINDMVQGRGTITVGIDASSMLDTGDEDDDTVYLSIPTVKASSYSLGYSFRIPLPPLKDFWAWRSEETGEDKGETPNGNREAPETGRDTGPILSINSSIAGKLQHPKQRVQVENEETGEREFVEVELPAAIFARNLSLGASINHTVQGNGLNRGVLNRFPFSLLSQSSVSVGATLLPTPIVQTSISKSVVPVKGTRPFQLSLQATCHDSPLYLPPNFELHIARQIGVRKVAYCTWSSGTLDWPDIVRAIFSPLISLGPDAGVAIENPSKFAVGFVSPPQHRSKLEEEDDDTGGEGEEYEADSGDTRHSAHAASKFDPCETWSFEINTSPETESITFNYSRNLFSGKPDEPLRSEWSGENHHTDQPVSTSRAVRLQVQTALNSDFSLVWMILGSRMVGEFTRMGLGIGVQGNRGLVFSVSWSRLGQSIKVPIAVCPLRAFDTDIGALAVILPWVTYTAVEFGILRPRERRRRQRAIARRRKELRKLNLQRKAESSQATSLMSDQVKRRQAKESENHGLVITRAEYGYFSSQSYFNKRGEPAESVDQTIYVTIPVAALVDKRQLIISNQVIKSQILGFYDPAPLMPKRLKIWYLFGGQEHFVEVQDAEGVTCPMKAHLVSP